MTQQSHTWGHIWKIQNSTQKYTCTPMFIAVLFNFEDTEAT